MEFAICGIGIFILILLIILLIVFTALPLYITARILDEDKGLLTAFGTTVLLIITFFGCLALIPFKLIGLIIAIIVNLLFVKVIYDTSWGKAFVIWIIAIIMAIVIAVVVFLIAGIGILALLALS